MAVFPHAPDRERLSLDDQSRLANIAPMAEHPKTGGAKTAAPDPAAVRVTAAKCARCGASVVARFRPFCSQRCSEIDLGQWASGSYRVATQEEVSGPDEETES